MAKKVEKWIGEIDLKEGALRATARREGAMTERGTIKVSWLRKKAKGKGITARRARLALKFRGFQD